MKNGPYILVRAPEEYPGKKYREKYVYEHILVWWKKTGILAPDGYQIHHKNGNKHDNRFKNLEMVFKSTHMKVHSREKTKKWTHLNCDWCNKIFSIETRHYKSKLKIQSHFHCSRSCQVKRQHKILRCNSGV